MTNNSTGKMAGREGCAPRRKGSVIRREETTYRYDVKVDHLNGPLNVQGDGEGGNYNIYLTVENPQQLRDWLQQLPDVPIQLLNRRLLEVDRDGAEPHSIQNIPLEGIQQEA